MEIVFAITTALTQFGSDPNETAVIKSHKFSEDFPSGTVLRHQEKFFDRVLINQAHRTNKVGRHIH